MVCQPDTHEVLNQVPPLEGYDVFAADEALREAVDREGAGWARPDLSMLGTLAGTAGAQELGRLANENRPVLHTHDRYGHRIDVVEYHPAYHDLMSTSVAHGLHAGPWADPRGGAHVARAAKVIVWYQVDAGHICPISMTYAVVPALRHQPDVAGMWEPMICSDHLRSGQSAGHREGRRDLRHGPHRKARGLGCAGQHDPCGSRRGQRRWHLCAHRAQMVLFRTDVRCLLDAGPGSGRHQLLSRSPLEAGRHAQPDPHPAVEGQAGRPIERIQRDRAGRRLGTVDR